MKTTSNRIVTIRQMRFIAVISSVIFMMLSCDMSTPNITDSYVITEDAKFGIIDSVGNVVIQPKYLYLTNFDKEHLSVAVVDTILYSCKKTSLKGDKILVVKYGYLNTRGKFIFSTPFIGTIQYYGYESSQNVLKKFCNTRKFNNGLAIYEDSTKIMDKLDKEDGLLYGFIDKDGNIVDSCRYADAKPYKDGVAAVKKKPNNSGDETGTWGYIDTKGNEICPFKFAALESPVGNRAIAQIGYEATIDPAKEYNSIENKEYSISTFLVDGKGNLIKQLDISYEYSSFTKDGLAVCYPNRLGSFWGRGCRFLQKNGEFLKIKGAENLTQSETEHMISNPLNLGALPNDVVFLDATGFCEGFAAVKIDNEAWIFVDKSFIVKGHQGKEVYQDAFPFSNGLAAVKRGGKWGYINKDFRIVIPCKYDSCGYAGRNLCKVFSSSDEGSIKTQSYINRKGEIIWQYLDIKDKTKNIGKPQSSYGKWIENVEYEYDRGLALFKIAIILVPVVLVLLMLILLIFYIRLPKPKVTDNVNQKNGSSENSRIIKNLDRNEKNEERLEGFLYANIYGHKK